MLALYDQNAPKKPTNLSVNSDLLKKARDLDINLSAALEQALTDQLKAKQAQQWLELLLDSRVASPRSWHRPALNPNSSRRRN